MLSISQSKLNTQLPDVVNAKKLKLKHKKNKSFFFFSFLFFFYNTKHGRANNNQQWDSEYKRISLC